MMYQSSLGASIHYEIIDCLAPEPMVFLHGNLGANSWWKPSLPFFSSLTQEEDRVAPGILLEFPGSGKSSTPKSSSEISIPIFTQHFLELLISLKIPKFHLVGHSTGGLIATYMMSQRPDLFGKAVLLDPVGAKGLHEKPGIQETYERMRTSREFTGSIIKAIIYGNETPPPALLETLIDDAFMAVQRIGAGVVNCMLGLDSKAIYSSVINPVLVLHGENDLLLPRSDSEDVAKLLRRGQFAVLPGQGHCANVENPQLIAETVDHFLYPTPCSRSLGIASH